MRACLFFGSLPAHAPLATIVFNGRQSGQYLELHGTVNLVAWNKAHASAPSIPFA